MIQTMCQVIVINGFEENRVFSRKIFFREKNSFLVGVDIKQQKAMFSPKSGFGRVPSVAFYDNTTTKNSSKKRTKKIYAEKSPQKKPDFSLKKILGE